MVKTSCKKVRLLTNKNMNKGLMVIYVLQFINLLIVANKHGQPREDYNFWITLLSNFITLVLIWWMLGWKFY